MRKRMIRVVALTACLGTLASAQTVIVTSSSNVVDIDFFTGTIQDLPGPDGVVTFREALVATDNTPGHQTIGFNIPVSDWQMQWLYPGRAVITPGGGLRAFDEVTIDGTTQTAFTGDTHPDGWEVTIYGGGVTLLGDNSTLIGFDSIAVSLTGSNGVIQGNTGNMNIDVFGGSGGLIQGNTGGTIKIDRSNDNLVVGNTVQRVRVWGFMPQQPALENRIGGFAPGERNLITGYGTTNSEGLPAGTTVQIFDTVGTIVENNWIGTRDGLTQGSQFSTAGIGFEGENHGTIVEGNLISGILGHGQGPHHQGQLFGRGIIFQGTGSGIRILDNTIGPDINGAPTLGAVWGVDVADASRTSYTDIVLSGNEIAGHYFNGITVGLNTSEIRLSRNAIHDNGWLGIDLVPQGFGYGVTPNDALDGDAGGNDLQNFPVLTSVVRQENDLRARGSLASSPFDTFTIELFASPVCDDSGHGEEEVFLGDVVVVTDAAGNASFDVALPTLVPAGWTVAATATREPIGATSELSACVPVNDLRLELLGNLVRRTTTDLQVSGAEPGEVAWFLYSLSGTGAGPCVPQLGGLCLDLLPTVWIGGNVAADVAGEARFPVFIPGNAPLLTLHFQAVIRRGSGGATSIETGVVSATIQP